MSALLEVIRRPSALFVKALKVIDQLLFIRGPRSRAIPAHYPKTRSYPSPVRPSHRQKTSWNAVFPGAVDIAQRIEYPDVATKKNPSFLLAMVYPAAAATA